MSCLPVCVGVLTHITLCQFEFSKSGRKITLLLAYIGTSQLSCISYRNTARGGKHINRELHNIGPVIKCDGGSDMKLLIWAAKTD